MNEASAFFHVFYFPIICACSFLNVRLEMKECCTQLTGISVYAEDPRIIVSSYLAAFLTWSLLFKFDFISEKWRTISETEISASRHIAITIPPITMVIFYAYVQGLAGDIKEMMTAIVSLCLAIFHLLRTLSGLLQLEAFKDWCKDALNRMKLIEGIKFSDAELDFRRRIHVNNSVVDNELSGNELGVTLALNRKPFRILSTKNPDLCTLRWMAPFLCVYGDKLQGFSSKSDIKYLFKYCSISLETLLYVVFQGKFDSKNKSIFSATEVILKDTEKVDEQYELEFNSQLGNYPKTGSEVQFGDPKNASVKISDSLILSKMFDAEKLVHIQEFKKFERTNNSTPVLTENGWMMLLEQNFEFNREEEENNRHHMNLPPFPWITFMLPLWEVDSNYRVLQASAHRDIFSALDNGIVVDNSQFLSENPFESCRRIQLGRSIYRFSGCVLESVRSFLASWVDANSVSSEVGNWNPEFESNQVFVCFLPLSEYCVEIGEENDASFRRDERLIWELQAALHKTIDQNWKSEAHLPQCPSLVCLFLLGYPCLHTRLDKDEEDELSIVSIEPGLKVQNVSMKVKINSGSSVCRVELLLDGNEKIFSWQSWINSALGIIKGCDDIRKERGSKNLRERLIEEINLTRPLVNISVSNWGFLHLTEGSVKIWTGWPPFDLKICSFEMNNWLRAKNTGSLRNLDKQMLLNAEESLEHFLKHSTDII